MSRKNTHTLFFLLGLSMAIVLFLVANSPQPWAILPLFGAFSLGILFVFGPISALFALLFVRPLVDFSSEKTLLTLSGFSINFASALGTATVVGISILLLKKYFDIKKIPLLTAWGLFILWTILSLPFSINPSASVSEIVRILALFGIFCLAFALSKQNKNLFEKIFLVIIFSAIIPLAVSFYQFSSKTGLSTSFEEVGNRVFGSFAHPNPFAYFMALAVSLSIFFIFKKENLQRIFAIAFFPLALLSIGMTYTRGTWLLVAGVIILFGVIKKRTLLAVFAGLVLVAYFLAPPFQDRVNSIFSLESSSSISWRISLWQDTFGYVWERPFLGHGIGTSEDLILEKRGAGFGSTITHNDFLRMALDVGLIGLVLYLYLFISLIVLLVKKYQKEKTQDKKTALLAFSCFVVMLFLASAVDNIFATSALQIAFWASAGTLVSLPAGRQ